MLFGFAAGAFLAWGGLSWLYHRTDYAVTGSSPWCIVPASGNKAATCEWLSQQHCEQANYIATATKSKVCVPNPRR